MFELLVINLLLFCQKGARMKILKYVMLVAGVNANRITLLNNICITLGQAETVLEDITFTTDQESRKDQSKLLRCQMSMTLQSKDPIKKLAWQEQSSESYFSSVQKKVLTREIQKSRLFEIPQEFLDKSHMYLVVGKEGALTLYADPAVPHFFKV